MNPILRKDLQDFEQILDKVKENGIDFLNALDQIPTTIIPPAIQSADLSANGEGTLVAMAFFKQHYQQLMVSSSGPRYWGYVIGGTTPAALAGDWLCSVFDQNPQSISMQGDISAMLELETLRLMRQLFSLPAHFYGGFVSGATMSNFTSLAVARQWAGKQLNHDIARDGMQPGIKILSATPHSSALKSLAMLGFGSSQLIKVKTNPDRESIDLSDLESLLLKYKDAPVILITSAGTVNTSDFDDLKAIAQLKSKYNFWYHADAAFGGFAACSPVYAHLLDGWEMADSITIDCHKWMNVPYDSAVFFVKEEHKQLQVQTFQNSNAPYLGDPQENFSFANALPENSRRFRALPAWFNLVAYGKDGFKDIVENSITLAKSLGDFIEKSNTFRLLAPVKLNTICFTLEQQPERVAEFLKLLNSRGKVFLTPGKLADQACIRVAFSNWRTTAQDVEIAITEMQITYELLESQSS